MGKIDFDKFLIDYVNSGFSKKRMLVNYLLEQQGLKIVKDEIVPIKDNKEPRLKIENGKWYVCIRNLDDHYGTLAFHNGHTYYSTKDETLMPDNSNIPFKVKYYAEHYFRPWTIQDAKAGDVLSFNDGHGNDCIELIKSITDKKIEFWFCLTNGNRYEVFDGVIPYTNIISREDATPATKEQREQIEKAMTDTGYWWNAEELKLEKIEHNPAWSEEDENRFRNLIYLVEHSNEGNGTKEGFVKFINRLKSLIPQNWTKEDKKRYISCLQKLSTGNPEQPETINLKWFKEHVYPQTVWKPSDEQMEAVRIARDRNDKIGFYLSQLYDDLKKLM